MKRMNQSVWSLLVVIAFVLILFLNALKLEFWVSKILPLFICTLILILALMAIFNEIFGKKPLTEKTKKIEKSEDEAEFKKSPLPVIIWVLGYFIGVFCIGFLIATPLFVGGYMKQNGAKWPQTLMTTGIFTTVFIILFNYVLKANLYQGILVTTILD